VEEQARGKGIGAALMMSFLLEAASRGYRYVSLTVDKSNRRAQSAYENFGWVIVDVGADSLEYRFEVTALERIDSPTQNGS
jgi:ribosomal protein S18 acetylase RimI-like enzyme